MGCERLKKRMVFLALVLPVVTAAKAEESAETIAIAVSLLALKAVIIAIILAFFRMEFRTCALTLFVGCAVTYFAIFRPVLTVYGNLLIAKVITIVTDVVYIRTLSLFSFFRQEDFKELGWPIAFTAAIAGNVVFYCIGGVLGVQ
jgi:hypothetical protein